MSDLLDEHVVARARSPRGDVVLRRRPSAIGEQPGGHLELRVAGVLAMDTAHTGAERALAERSSAGLRSPLRVMVGGLGLGFTVSALLDDDRVCKVVVAEIESAVVDWVRGGLVPRADGLLDDPRVQVRVADVADVVRAAGDAELDLVLLDVDNGPEQLVHQHNAGLYRPEMLREYARVLAPGGRVAVWSAEDAPRLAAAMSRWVGPVETHRVPVRLQGRQTAYWVLRATRCPGGARASTP